MKTRLIELSKRLEKMYLNGAPRHLVVEARNTELAKILKDCEDALDTGISNLSRTRQEIIDSATYHPKDDTEALARRLRMESEFSSMPRGQLLKYESEDVETLYMQASTLRKRGMHDEADDIFARIVAAKQAPYLSPVVKGLEKEITRFTLLKPSQDPDHLWIGTDPRKVTPADIATIDRATGKIMFKDNDGNEVEV